MLKRWTVVLLTAAIGGVIGASGLLCPDGSCPITGSWYGGAAIGGLIGWVLAGMVWAAPASNPVPVPAPASEPAPGKGVDPGTNGDARSGSEGSEP